MQDLDAALDALSTIERLVTEAMAIADAQQEFLIGAFLDQCLHSVRDRLAEIEC